MVIAFFETTNFLSKYPGVGSTGIFLYIIATSQNDMLMSTKHSCTGTTYNIIVRACADECKEISNINRYNHQMHLHIAAIMIN